MKNNIFILLILLFSSCINNPENTTNNKTVINKATKQLRHVVLFKFKETSSAIAIKKIETAFINLPTKIKEIKAFEWGLNNSPEKLNKGFTHCFFVSFSSEEDRSIYLPHPAHKAFVSLLKPHLEDVLVLDYWVK